MMSFLAHAVCSHQHTHLPRLLLPKRLALHLQATCQVCLPEQDLLTIAPAYSMSSCLAALSLLLR